MIKNYFKIAIRNILKKNVYSLINIFGLAVGITASILIALWVQDELNFDKFNKHTDSTYRIIAQGPNFRAPMIPAPLLPKIRDELPVVENGANVVKIPDMVFKYNNMSFTEKSGIIADSSLFSILSFPFLQGQLKTAFSDPTNIIVTEQMAHKYFGDEEPIGKTLYLNGSLPLKVSGILMNVPHNSHLQFDYVLPSSILKMWGVDLVSWGNLGFTSYLQLRPGTDVKEVNDEINTLYRKNRPQVPGDAQFSFYLQPLTRIHLASGIQYDSAVLGDTKYVYIFSFSALLILFIACMNFFNLVTANSSIRFKEVGLRKSIGATQPQLVVQFLVEYILIILIALLQALILVMLTIPFFNQISGKLLTVNFFDPKIISGLFLITIVTTAMAVTYPAINLSALNPAKGIKPNFFSVRNNENTFRKVLVIFQFTLSIALIISTAVIQSQLTYMRNTSIGFDKEGIVYLPLRGNLIKNYHGLKQLLLQYPSIESVSAKDYLPTIDGNSTVPSSGGFYWEGRKGSEELQLEFTSVDYDYFQTMGTVMADGRMFSKDFKSDENEAFILNEEAVRQMELENPLGKWVVLNGQRGKIIGVAKNAHFKSLQYQMSPQLFSLLTDQKLPAAATEGGGKGIVFIRVKGGDVAAALKHIQSEWDKINPGIPFEYSFLDQTIDTIYKSEKKIDTIFKCFTALAIFISCLGLFGLSLFLVQNKKKEIGIRKVNGAKVSEILTLLNFDFVKWVAIAFLIACPIAWYAMHKWLESFAYKTALSWWIFALAGLLALGIALLTVSWQSWRAATRNPVEALRYE
ncbi:MAG: ABC transporter permease [Bacteroidia bacterium]|nr:ABC transporter permease [Bacteroidia bacterium]